MRRPHSAPSSRRDVPPLVASLRRASPTHPRHSVGPESIPGRFDVAFGRFRSVFVDPPTPTKIINRRLRLALHPVAPVDLTRYSFSHRHPHPNRATKRHTAPHCAT